MFPLAPPPPAALLLPALVPLTAPVAAAPPLPGLPVRSRLLVDLPATGGGQPPLLQRVLPLFALL